MVEEGRHDECRDALRSTGLLASPTPCLAIAGESSNGNPKWMQNLGGRLVVLPFQQERKYSTQISNQGSGVVRICISGILQTVRTEASTPERFHSETGASPASGAS